MAHSIGRKEVQYTPNMAYQQQMEINEVETLRDVTGKFPEDLFRQVPRFQIGNLNADLRDLEIPTKLLQANERLLRVGYVDLTDDRLMNIYGSAMSWAYPHQFMNEFPMRSYTNDNGFVEYMGRTPEEYAAIARKVFESLILQNPGKILALETYLDEDDERQFAGVYLNMGEIDFFYPPKHESFETEPEEYLIDEIGFQNALSIFGFSAEEILEAEEVCIPSSSTVACSSSTVQPTPIRSHSIAHLNSIRRPDSAGINPDEFYRIHDALEETRLEPVQNDDKQLVEPETAVKWPTVVPPVGFRTRG